MKCGSKNESASKFVNDVLSNPGTVRTELSRGGVEYRLPKGDFGISKEISPNRVPGAFGGSFFSEITGKGIEKRTGSAGEGDK